MKIIFDLYYLNKLKKLEKLEDETSTSVYKLECRMRDIEHDIYMAYINGGKGEKANIQEILKDDSPKILGLKHEMLNTGIKLNDARDRYSNIKMGISECKRELGLSWHG